MATDGAGTGYERQLADVRPGDHLCMFYDSDEERLGALASFVRNGLARGEACLCIVGDAGPEPVLRRLAGLGLDVVAERERGALRFEPADAVYPRDGSFDAEAAHGTWRRAEQEALAAGFAGLRAAVDVPQESGLEANVTRWLDYEASPNDVLAGSRTRLLCQYDLRRLTTRLVLDLLRAHPTVVLGRGSAGPEGWLQGQVQRPRDSEREARALHRASLAISGELDLEARLERVLDAALEVTGAGHARIVLEVAETGEVEFAAVRGLPGRRPGDRQPRDVGLIGAVLARNGPVRTGNGQADPRMWDRESMRRFGIRSRLGVPLVDGGHPFGVLLVVSEAADRFGDGEEQRLLSLGALAGSAIREARLRRQLEQELEVRRHAEDELRRQKEMLQRIFDNAPIAINLFDERGAPVLVNREWERIFGWTVQELGERGLDIYLEALPSPAERQRARDLVAAATGAWADYRITRRDGTTLDVLGAIVRLSDGTGIGLSQDITERKHAEEALFRQEQVLRAVIETAPDMIIRIDRDLRYAYVNPAFERAQGLPADAFIGRLAGETTMAPGAAETWRQTLRQVFATGREQTVELPVRAGGRERVLQLRAAPELGPDGQVEHVVTVSRDVTERARREEEQTQLYQELMEREERLQALVRRALLAREQEQRRLRGLTELEQLTRRERETLALLTRGLTTRQIAEQLVISPVTAKSYIERILAKLGVANRTQAATRAVELGLLDEHPPFADLPGADRGTRTTIPG